MDSPLSHLSVILKAACCSFSSQDMLDTRVDRKVASRCCRASMKQQGRRCSIVPVTALTYHSMAGSSINLSCEEAPCCPAAATSYLDENASLHHTLLGKHIVALKKL